MIIWYKWLKMYSGLNPAFLKVSMESLDVNFALLPANSTIARFPDKCWNASGHGRKKPCNGWVRRQQGKILCPDRKENTVQEKNIELVKTIRDAVGYDVELAGDAWMSWNYNFALKMPHQRLYYSMNCIPRPSFQGCKLRLSLQPRLEIPRQVCTSL